MSSPAQTPVEHPHPVTDAALPLTSPPEAGAGFDANPHPRRGARRPGGAAFWFVVGSAIALMVATSPGQTAGVSAFIDPMMAGVGIDRATISTAYLIGTLFGAAALPFVGRWVDRFGAARSTVVVGALYTAAVAAMSLVSGAMTLTFGFMALRSLGQGALGLIAITVVSQRVDPSRRGRALGLVAAVGGAGMALVPMGIDASIGAVGWRHAWQLCAMGVILLLVPTVLATLVRSRRPSHADRTGGQGPGDTANVEVSYTLAQAIRQPYFWVLAVSVGLSGLLITAVLFHQFDLLGRRGLSTTQVAAMFVPQAIAALLATLAAGHLVDRYRPRLLVATGMVLHTVGFLLVLIPGTGWNVVGYAMALGAAGGFLRTVEAASLVGLFGPAHLGSLRGVVSAVAVGGTALGPVLYSLSTGATGQYSSALWVSAALPLVVAVWAYVARPPARPDSQPAALATDSVVEQ